MTQDVDSTLLERLARGRYDFIDAGCGVGGSIDYCQRVFRCEPGLGFDLNAAKIREARENEVSVMHRDLTEVDFPDDCVVFSSMLDFLEHLPDEATAQRILKRLGRASRDFLFIRHPSFEDIDYLRRYNLKLAWTDWTGHRNMMTVEHFRSLFARLGFDDFVIIARDRIRDSSHPAIVPLSAPTDTIRYESGVHEAKCLIEFDKAVFERFDMFVRLSPALSDEDWCNITGRTMKNAPGCMIWGHVEY
jgi:SAM-dependent methyltransferase